MQQNHYRLISVLALSFIIVGLGIILSKTTNVKPLIQAAPGNPSIPSQPQTTPRDFTGVIGVQIWRNPKRLQPLEWYNSQSFPKGSPQSTTVDGFPGLKEGTSVYVSAPNYVRSVAPQLPNAYVNVYLLSYGQGSDSATQEITKRLLANWQFLGRLPADVAGGPALAREQLRRDNERLTALGTIIKSLDQYRAANNSYPALSSGSYLSGRSVSTWPSWQQTLGASLGGNLPVDPINNFDSNNDGQSNCDVTQGYNEQTCYAPPSQGRPNGDYQCLNGVHVFEYQNVNSSVANLFSNFEFKNISWPGSLPNTQVTISDLDGCRSFGVGLGSQGANWGVTNSPPNS